MKYIVQIIKNSNRKIIFAVEVMAANEDDAIHDGLFLFSQQRHVRITRKFLMSYSVRAEIKR